MAFSPDVVRAVAWNVRTMFAGAVTGHEWPKSIREGDPLAEQQQQSKAAGEWKANCTARRHPGSHMRLLIDDRQYHTHALRDERNLDPGQCALVP